MPDFAKTGLTFCDPVKGYGCKSGFGGYVFNEISECGIKKVSSGKN
jgi:hypothetical protein